MMDLAQRRCTPSEDNQGEDSNEPSVNAMEEETNNNHNDDNDNMEKTPSHIPWGAFDVPDVPNCNPLWQPYKVAFIICPISSMSWNNP